MKTPVKIVVTVPTYCEIENIEALVAAILEQDPRIEVLVADDDSPDGTWKKVAELAAVSQTRQAGRPTSSPPGTCRLPSTRSARGASRSRAAIMAGR